MSEPLVDIEFSSGEWVQATAEDAIEVAKFVGWEARQHEATHGFNPLVTFRVGDDIVRAVALRDLT